MNKIYVENIDHERAVQSDKLNFLNYCYAHGKLERMAGFDLISEDKKHHFDKRKNINGEMCIAVLPDGTEIPALFFYWKTTYIHVHKFRRGEYKEIRKDPHGLLVDTRDIESIEYAQKCFNEKSKWL